MELLIAVFGLLFYGIAIAGDKSKHREFSRRSEDRITWHNARRDAWTQKVYSAVTWHEAEEFIESQKQWVCLLAQAYIQLPSCRDLTETQAMTIIYDRLKYNKKNNREYRKCLMWIMSQRGSIVSPVDNDIVTFGASFTEREKLAWDMEYEFAMLILSEIRKVSPESRIIYENLEPLEWEKTVYDAERDIDKFRYKPGSLHWLHLTYFDDDLKYR